jgi:hypothetical protein
MAEINLRPSKAPNIPIAPVTYDQRYIDQLTNALRLYFTQIDNFTGFLAQPIAGTTADRPAVQLHIGQLYFDTTLLTLILWDGTTWIPAVPASATPVTSFSAGSTGFTPNTATTGAVTLAGTLAAANGGTGQTSLAAVTVGNANQITNSGGWSVTPSGTKLYFNYNGANVASLDSSGNLITLANITAYGTP